ncbi:unnamed protein product [Caenorhabditis nigoni]
MCSASGFRLAERLPKISLAEKAVPLYISKLSICEEGFYLNGTKYQLGVNRQAREGPNFEIIDWENQRGGSVRDYDMFGIEKRSLPELTPGDLFIQDYNPLTWNDNLESAEARMKRYRKLLKALQKERMDLEFAPEELENTPGNLVEQEQDQLGRRRDQVLGREQRLERVNGSIRQMKINLEYAGLAVQRFQCERDNIPSPYDMFVQFTKKSPDGTVYIERFNYEKRLMEARKYLICKFLANRQSVIKIKSLGFWARLRGGLIISLPEGIKLDVQEFGTSGNLSEVLQRVETILEHPNRPFDRLQSDSLKLEDVQNRKVRSAGVLVLHNVYFVDYVALCREAPNKKIVITLGRKMQPEQFGVIVENLIDTKGTLGTCYEITVLREEDEAEEVLRVVGQRFENAVVGEKLVTIPLPSQLQLNVSYEPYQYNSRILKYKITMNVMVRNQVN